MSCSRAREVDIAGFVADPRAAEHREFRQHYPGCRTCAAEVARWTLLEGALREVTERDPHPAEELLLAYRRAPDTLAPEQRAELAQHLESCAPCRDALGAVVGLDLERLLAGPPAAAPQEAGESAGPWSRLVDGLRGLFELPTPAWAAIAIVLLVIAAGLPWLLAREGAPPAPVARREAPPPEPAPAPLPQQAPPEQLAGPTAEPSAPAPQTQAPEAAESQQLAAAPHGEPAETGQPLAPEPSPDETVAQSSPLPPAGKTPPQAEAPRAAPPTPPAPALIAALGPEPIRFLPRTGLPAGRIAGGRRGAGSELPSPLALTPETVGLTLEAQPSLYWFLPSRAESGVRIDVSDIGAMQTVLSKTVGGPLAAGVHALRLADHGVRLATGHDYQWMLTPVGSEAPASGGIVRRIAPDASLNASLSGAPPAQRLRVLASGGVWYDALDLLSRSIAARPADTRLRQARADLLEQQGLPSAAAWDRAAR